MRDAVPPIGMHPRAEEFTERVRDEYGVEIDVHEFPERTKTTADAAEAVGCSIEQIASGIVLSADGDLLASVTSGANRVSEARLAERLGVDPAAGSMADPRRYKGDARGVRRRDGGRRSRAT